MQKALALDPAKMGLLLSGFGWAYVVRPVARRADCSTASARSVCTASASCAGRCARSSSGLPAILPAALAFSVIFVSALAVRPGAIACLSWQWPHRRSLVSHCGARSRLRDLQCLAVFRAWSYSRRSSDGSPIPTGGRSCFWFMGIFGLVLAFVWSKTVYNVNDHPHNLPVGDRVHRAEAAAW